MPIDPQRSVGRLVADCLARARVFDDLGIDFCCHGQTSLQEACQSRGLDLSQVLERLDLADQVSSWATEPDYSAMPLSQLADHIESTHHVFMRQELPRLQQLHSRVAETHAQRHPELIELGQTLAALRDEIDAHLMKEERILFPIIRQLEAATSLPQFHCGSVENPIRVMEHEHDNAGNALARMRELTSGYATPADACASYQALLAGLQALETDLHLHIHKENNILFPKTAALEHSLGSTAAQ